MKQKITGADYPGENIHYLNRIQLMISILYIYIFAKMVSSFWDVEVLDSVHEKFIRIAYTAVDPFYY